MNASQGGGAGGGGGVGGREGKYNFRVVTVRIVCLTSEEGLC